MQGWVERGLTVELRKKDALLSYLTNARGADEHTVQAIVAGETGIVTIGPAEGGNADFEVSIPDADGTSRFVGGRNVTTISVPVLWTRITDHPLAIADRPIVVNFKAAELRLLPVINRGRTYPLPTAHRGQFLRNLGPVEAAELGSKFYDDYFKRAEEFSRIDRAT